MVYRIISLRFRPYKKYLGVTVRKNGVSEETINNLEDRGFIVEWKRTY